jgi:hypothetical protein
MSDEERLAKKKERSRLAFSEAAYKNRYDASKGFGSPDEWIRAAEALLDGRLVLLHNIQTISADLIMFGLDELPTDLSVLKTAYRKRLFTVHPDYGGTEALTMDAVAAFERLVKNYSK